MMLIDSHAHIYLPEFSADRDLMVERARNEQVVHICLPAIDSVTHDEMISMEELYRGTCFAMMGVHPCSIKANFREELKIARDYLDKRNFIALGETGLDFYWDLTYTNEQYEAFHEQIEWAIHFDLPLVIHSRDSIDECIQVVREHQNARLKEGQGKLKGVFHCFSGNEVQAGEIIDLGFYLGIGGVITFKNAGLDKVMSGISLDKVILETDAPYLAPVPFRGKRNEPFYLKYVVEKLVEIKNISREEVASVTTANAQKLFEKLRKTHEE